MPRRFAIVTTTVLAACATRTDERLPPQLAAYRAAFEAAAGERVVAAIDDDELRRRIAAGRVLWLGDHHRHQHLHQLQRRLLERLQQDGVPMALGLEAIGAQDQPLVDAYLAGEIELSDLRHGMRARWSASWLDDDALDPFHFRTLLQFAHRHRLPVFAIEPTPRLPLAERDATMAAAVQAAARRWPDRLLVVHVGQAHLLGEGHLVQRCPLPGVALAAVPTAALAATAPVATQRAGTCFLTDRDVCWFAEVFAPLPD
ncbi:MAG: ChaN family lipoprotein [Planctomycetes bacterium]|nr:ChaN family lipoprotein [Planctomycetota bacterium]